MTSITAPTLAYLAIRGKCRGVTKVSRIGRNIRAFALFPYIFIVVSAEQSPEARSPQSVREDFRDVLAVLFVAALVLAAAVVGRQLDAHGTPVFAGFPPLQGVWDPHFGWGTIPSVVLLASVVTGGRRLFARMGWAALMATTMTVATGWTIALSLVDGWDVGFADRLTRRYEYLVALPRVGSWHHLFSTFNESIPIDSVDRWPTHVAGHPPLALVPFEALDRLGLSGGAWAALFCVLIGSSAAVALLVIARSLVDVTAARTLAPFVALAPGAIWIGVSADAIVLGVCTWGIACLAFACSGVHRMRAAIAFVGGVLLGMGVYLSYGMLLMLPVAAILLIARGRRSTAVWAVLGLTVVVTIVSGLGFNWWQGYHLVVERYAAGLGGDRPYSYWVWADLAAFALACGPAVVVGTRRLFVGTEFVDGWSFFRKPRNTVSLLVCATLGAVLAATLGGLSKGEVERIWLPFGTLLLLACLAIPSSKARMWLAAQGVLVLILQHLVMTPW